MKRVHKALAGLVVATAVLAATEGITRFFVPLPGQTDPGEDAMLGSSLLGWELVPGPNQAFGVPGGTTIGPLGIRNPGPGPKAAGSKRLLTLGDSTIYGVLIRDGEVFVEVAADRLGRALGHPVEPINGGVPGYSSEQSRRLYRHRLRDLEADWVIICNLWSDSQLAPDPDHEIHPESRLMAALQELALVHLLERSLRGRPPAPPPGGQGAQGGQRGHNQGRQVAWQLTPAEDDGTRVPLPRYRDNLTELVEMVRADGAQPVFLMLPSDRDLEGRTLEPPRNQYRATMAALSTLLQVPLVDGVTPFQGGAASLMADDVHPSASGHRLLGETLAGALGAL